MPSFTVGLLKKALKKNHQPAKGIKVGILGLAYKPNVADTRESPAFEIIKNLKKLGVEVISCDPYVNHKTSVPTLKDLLKKSQAVILVTAHQKFLELKPSDLVKNNVD